MRLAGACFTSFLLYVGQVYWLHEAKIKTSNTNAKTLFINVVL